MKKFNLSLVAVLAMSTFAVAGGDIAPVEPVVETPIIEEVSVGGLYLGLGYSFMMGDITEIDNSHDLGADHSALMLQAGYKFNDYVAVEGRYWFGLSDEAFAFDNDFYGRFDTEVDAWGIYVKPMYPVTDAFDIYALLGYGETSVEGITTNDGHAHDIESDGFSWGVGAAYAFSENVSIFLDYVAFDDTSINYTHGEGSEALEYNYDHELDTINFGVTYTF